ncbi:MAG: hypothetical protein HY824_13300 [Acidobacteria bacterium]|nr:hypothetical protein [Acidobacteriota bacterium]
MSATDRPTERSFGVSVGGVCLAAAALAWWRGHTLAGPVLLVCGTLLVGFAAAAPAGLRLPNRVWWRLAQALGWVNSRILLTVFFAAVLAPVGLALRLCGRNPLSGRKGHSNWGPYPVRRGDPTHYEHLF